MQYNRNLRKSQEMDSLSRSCSPNERYKHGVAVWAGVSARRHLEGHVAQTLRVWTSNADKSLSSPTQECGGRGVTTY